MIGPAPPRDAQAQMTVTTATQCTLDPFTLGMSFEERLHGLAVEGGPLLVADDFEPNKGLGVRPYPPDIAPPGAIEIHMASNQRKGRVIVLPKHVRPKRFHFMLVLAWWGRSRMQYRQLADSSLTTHTL